MRGPTIVLVHSVNAASSAAEMRPLFAHCGATRTVFAIDLPGFGLSERSARRYDPRLMTDALHALARQVRSRCGAVPIDALAVSLGCEFVARAAVEQPARWGLLAFVSPTGLSGRMPLRAAPGSTRAMPWLHALLSAEPWSRSLYGVLTRPAVIRHFYESLPQPEWMSHGVRGDFADFRGRRLVQDTGNWATSVYPTGALPYFERPAEFFADYDAFLAGRTSEQGMARAARARQAATPA